MAMLSVLHLIVATLVAALSAFVCIAG